MRKTAFGPASRLPKPSKMPDATQKPGAPQTTSFGDAATHGVLSVFFGTYCRLTARGIDHIPDGPVLFCSNHSSHLDGPALLTSSKRRCSHMVIIVARDYFVEGSPMARAWSSMVNVLPLDRKDPANSFRHVIKQARRWTDAGASLIAFPEGTRARDGRYTGEVKPGAALLSVALGIPIVPAYIAGAHQCLPPGRIMAMPGRIHVAYGPPIDPAEISSRCNGSKVLRTEISDRLAEAIRDLEAEIHGSGRSTEPRPNLPQTGRVGTRVGQGLRP